MILSYTLTTLWHDFQRFFAGVLAVAFSASLISLQTGLLFGLFSTTSAPIDHSKADIWIGAPNVLSVDLGRPISEYHLARLAQDPDVLPPEPLILDYHYWSKPNGSKELCIVIGSRLSNGAIGAIEELTPDLRAKLIEPGAVVVDQSELGRLGIRHVGEYAEISGHRVRVVGIIKGLKSLTGPFIFCSYETARELVFGRSDQVTYILAKSRDPRQARAVVDRFRKRYDLAAFTKEEFSYRTRMHWLMMTNAGISTLFTASLGLLVGAVVTSQTLYAATLSSMREYTVLRALGIPRWRIAGAVVMQAFWVGVVGIVIALPVVFSLSHVGWIIGTRVLLPWWLLCSVFSVTMAMALLSGLAALRSLNQMEPAALLR